MTRLHWELMHFLWDENCLNNGKVYYLCYVSDSTIVNLISSHGQFSGDLTTSLFGYWTMLVHSQNVLKTSGALEILAIKALS